MGNEVNERHQMKVCLSNLGSQAYKGAPNLDVGDHTTLWPFADWCSDLETRLFFFLLMFGGGFERLPENTSRLEQIAIATLLGDYARVKGEAVRVRLRGSIRHAEALEKRCEMIYRELPQWARW